MDGLDNTGGGKTIVNTFKGKFAIKSNSDNPKAISRLNKNNVQVYEEHYDTVTGFLVGIERYESDEYGYSWNFELLTEKGNKLIINLPYSGRTTMGVFSRLPNLKTDKISRLRIFYFEAEDKASLIVQQKDDKGIWKEVPRHWTKEDPKELPELEQVMRNNKMEWDASKRMAYIERYLKLRFAERLDKDVGMILEAYSQGGHSEESTKMPDEELYKDTEPDVEAKANPPVDLPEETDDLPF